MEKTSSFIPSGRAISKATGSSYFNSQDKLMERMRKCLSEETKSWKEEGKMIETIDPFKAKDLFVNKPCIEKEGAESFISMIRLS